MSLLLYCGSARTFFFSSFLSSRDDCSTASKNEETCAWPIFREITRDLSETSRISRRPPRFIIIGSDSYCEPNEFLRCRLTFPLRVKIFAPERIPPTRALFFFLIRPLLSDSSGVTISRKNINLREDVGVALLRATGKRARRRAPASLRGGNGYFTSVAIKPHCYITAGAVINHSRGEAISHLEDRIRLA